MQVCNFLFHALLGDPPPAAVTQRGAQEGADADGDGFAAAAVTQRGAEDDDAALGCKPRSTRSHVIDLVQSMAPLISLRG